MNNWTDFVVGHFVSGQASFSGVAICVIGCLLVRIFNHAWLKALARIMLLTGVVFVVLSAAPFPFWAYGLFFALLALAAFLPIKGRGHNKKVAGVLLLLLVVQSLLLVCAEVVRSRRPAIPFETGKTLVVLGDSMCMGADPPGKNWPELLGELAQLKVHNFSFGGAKVESSLSEARRISEDDALVIIELGGNDLLGGTRIPEFRQDLEKMLGLVCGPHRRVAMIELPLPPFYNRFGMVQRELAKSHGVTLIPKRYLAKIICTPGATVDGLHLSNAGHTLLAHAIFEMFIRTQ